MNIPPRKIIWDFGIYQQKRMNTGDVPKKRLVVFLVPIIP
jgi:hypothetical protein